MSIQKLRPAFTLDQDRIEQLKAIAPEAFADGKINWDALKAALGEHLEDQSPNAEHFGLSWPGKREARRFASKPSSGTLIPVPGEGVDEDSTHNIFIEGDNLETLKLLQKSYVGQVKLIYIDPPYNTGNDFVYEDDFKDPLRDYLKKTGQADQKGVALTTAPKASGRFHSNWLNMMYPRLRLARDLLIDDGAIFVSIDDHEIHHLRLLMDEIFGPENFVAQITILTNPKGRVLSEHFAENHDYLLVYAKSAADSEFSVPKTESEVIKDYPHSDEHGKYRLLELRNTHRQFGLFSRPNLFYPLYIDQVEGTVSLKSAKGLIEVYPIWDDGFEGCWTWGRAKVAAENALLIGKRIGSTWKVFRKSYAVDSEGEITRRKLKTIWTDKEFQTEKGQAAFDELIPGRLFQSPKPVDLVRMMLKLCTTHGDLALDFFAGSCTTAQAVLGQNCEDGANRRFIMVQFPEPTNNPKFPTIAEIGKERIRRVSKQLKKEKAKGDLGFRVFKLAVSDFKQWQDYDGQDVAALEQQFTQFETPLVDGWTRENLLTEIILQQGFPLDSAITPQKEFTINDVSCVSSPASAHKLFVCLDEQIKDSAISQLKLAKHDVFICLDSALRPEAKVRLGDAINLVVI